MSGVGVLPLVPVSPGDAWWNSTSFSKPLPYSALLLSRLARRAACLIELGGQSEALRRVCRTFNSDLRYAQGPAPSTAGSLPFTGIRTPEVTEPALICCSAGSLERAHTLPLPPRSNVATVIFFDSAQPHDDRVALLSHIFNEATERKCETFVIDDQREIWIKIASEPFTGFNVSSLSSFMVLILPEENARTLLCFAHAAELGGAERSLLELVDELVSDEWVLCSVVCPSTGPLTSSLRAAGVATVVAPFPWWCRLGTSREAEESWLASGLSTLHAIFPTLQLINPDVIWTQTLTVPWGALSAQLLERPHIWSICEHGENDHELQFYYHHDDILQFIQKSADFIFTNSSYLHKELFPAADPARLDINHRHIVLPKISEQEQLPWRRPDALRIGVFGTIMRQKGQRDIVEAVAELHERGHDLELVLAGAVSDPDYLASLEKLAEERGLKEAFRHVGFLNDPYPVMASADVVVSCSRTEAFGRAVVEAMLLEKPIVYTAAGGHLDYMVDGETGLSYEPGDIRGLVERLTTLIEDAALRHRLGATAAQQAGRLFTAAEYGGKVASRLRACAMISREALAGLANNSLRVFVQLAARRVEPLANLQLPEWERELARVREALHLSREELRLSREQIAALELRLHGIETSTAWQLTYPLRASLGRYVGLRRIVRQMMRSRGREGSIGLQPRSAGPTGGVQRVAAWDGDNQT